MALHGHRLGVPRQVGGEIKCYNMAYRIPPAMVAEMRGAFYATGSDSGAGSAST